MKVGALVPLLTFLTGIISLPIIAEAETYYINVQKMPVQWQDKFGNVLYEATKYWQDRIPSLEFYSVPYPDQSDFVVTWASQYLEGKLGYYTTDTNNEYGKPYVTITLGFFKDKKFNLVDPEYATLIATHEIGHAIGFDHSNDPNDIMYPSIYDYDNWQKEKFNLSTETKLPPEIEPSTPYFPPPENTTPYLDDTKYKDVAYAEKSLYENKIDLLQSGITKAENTLSGLTFESPEAQKKIKQAWDIRWEALVHKNDAVKKLGDALSDMNGERYQSAYFKFKTIDHDSEAVGNNLKWISAAINDAKEIENEYKAQNQKQKFCFLFWCW